MVSMSNVYYQMTVLFILNQYNILYQLYSNYKKQTDF